MREKQTISFLCAAMDALPAGIAVTDGCGRIKYMNRAWQKFLQQNNTPTEKVSTIAQYLQICCADPAEAEAAAGNFAEGVRQLTAGEKPSCTMDFPCRPPEPGARPEWHLCLFCENGAQYVLVVCGDGAGQRQAEQRQDEFARLFHSTLDALNSLILLINREYRIVLCNWKDHEWVPEAERNQQPFCYKVLKNYDAPCEDCPPAKTFADGQPRWYEARNPIDGSYKEISVTPIFGENGAVVYVLENVRDVTEQKQIEAALRKSEEKYRSILASMEEGYFETDLAGNFVFYNDAMADILGYSRNEMRGLNYKQTMREDTAAVVFKTFNQVYRTGKAFKTYEWDLLRKDESVACVEASVTLRKDEHGNAVGFQGIARDVTERRKAEQEKERLHAQLRHAQKMEAIGTLAGGIAHDFNNILSAVLGYTELSLDEIPQDTKMHQNLSQVLTAGNRAKDLIRQILTLGRQEEQGFSPVPITSLVKEALKMLRSTFPASIDLRENICEEQLILQAEPTQLHQVIVNLATNARQAMPDETGVLEVCVDPVAIDPAMAEQYPDLSAGDYARIRFSDTGSGIPEHHLDRIFEPYFTTKEKETGTGLGLSMVHSIVANHQGLITVDSVPGRGTTFCVYLPLAGRDLPEPAASMAAVRPLPRGNERVLLVDDEEPVVEVQGERLKRLGYRVTAYTRSVRALEAFYADPYQFDILITDMTMPEMTGEQLASKIKGTRPDLPVILFTGYSEKLEAHRNDPDIDALLMKPVNKADMANTLRGLLDAVQKKN